MLDLCKTPDDKNRGTSVITVVTGASSIISYGLGSLQLKNLKIFSTNTQGVFYICTIFMIITTIITLATTREEPLISSNIHEEEEEELLPKQSYIRQFWNGIRYMKSPVIKIMFAYYFTSMAATPIMYFFTDFVGEDVYHGNPDPKSPTYLQYEKGVRVGSLGLAISNLVQLFYSVFLPTIHRKIGIKQNFFLCSTCLYYCAGSPFFHFF
eukprot:TRINITY_DN15452_c0_g1_i2.p1 TRINITY_DN15452_c0_g1~~TRINITY_DN15452_c0_g1_i2.p1  ORF type:complete len:210 (-),score=40.76 TRINITY_DN15452_c0_g1_i2:95-724(-)